MPDPSAREATVLLILDKLVHQPQLAPVLNSMADRLEKQLLAEPHRPLACFTNGHIGRLRI